MTRAAGRRPRLESYEEINSDSRLHTLAFVGTVPAPVLPALPALLGLGLVALAAVHRRRR